VGERRESGLYWVYLAMLAAVPLWWRSRMAWFSVIFCGAAWAAMAFTRDAGGSLHHTILLWPFPLLLMGAVLSRIPPGSSEAVKNLDLPSAGQGRGAGSQPAAGFSPLDERLAKANRRLKVCPTSLPALGRQASTSISHFPRRFFHWFSRPGAWTPVLAVAGVVMIGSNLLVLNQYLAQFERYGAGRDFTDALFPLQKAVPEGSNVYVVDWGMYNTLLLSHRRDGLLHTGNEPFMEDAMSEQQLKQALTMLGDRGAVFLGHVPGKVYFEGVGARLERFAATKGLRKEVMQVVDDSNGRPMFEVFRFKPR